MMRIRSTQIPRHCLLSRTGWGAIGAVSIALMLAGGCFDPSENESGETDDGTGSTSSNSPSTGLTTDASTSQDPTTDPDPGTSTGSGPGSDSDSTGTTSDSGMMSGTETDALACSPGELLGCDGDDLVQCNDDGTGEETTPCDLGCNETELRCNDVDPSNALGEYLDGADREAPLDLGTTASIDTDDGSVTVDDEAVDVTSFLVEGTPQIRVLVVGSLIAQDVTVSGTPALAIVSDGDIQISGHFSLSAVGSNPGPGALTDQTCQGGDQVVSGNNGNTAAGGAGGGGFGTAGADGGTAIAQGYQAAGGSGGGTTGSATLVPLRGGCDAGVVGASLRGAGGGAVQLVSRTSIAVEGILSANGTSRSGGGSGGGILLEAPSVSISGNVVANGGAGAGGGFVPVSGEDGRTDAQPAAGGPSNDDNLGEGGNGAAGNTAATAGADNNNASGLSTDLNFAGHGGGGAGRIRINVPDDGLTTTGIVSPNPTSGSLGIR